MIDVFERFAETRGRRSLKKKEKKGGRKEGRESIFQARTNEYTSVGQTRINQHFLRRGHRFEMKFHRIEPR